MKKNKAQGVNILNEPPVSKDTSIEFAYLAYLAVSESTVLGYLELPFQEEEEVKPRKIDNPNRLI